MWGHFVYLHRRASDGTPFYVGKGKLHRGSYDRAFDRASRNVWWRRIADKHGFDVEIVISCRTDAEAQQQEIRVIAEIGRADLKLGPLVNLTNGGDGHAGILIGEELRKKRSLNASKKRSDQWVKSIRAARKNGGNGGVVKRGDKLPEEWVANISAAKIGEKNPFFGKPSGASKKVKNLATGVVYDSINRAALAEGINPKTLYQYLDGTRINRSSLVRA